MRDRRVRVRGFPRDRSDAQQYEVKSVSSPEPLSTSTQVLGSTQHWSLQ